MAVYVEINTGAGHVQHTVELDRFWVGTSGSGCDLEMEMPGFSGRLIEIIHEPEGGLQVRVEAGLPFPVRSSTGTVSTRFETLLESDVLNVGSVMVSLRSVVVGDDQRGEEIDTSTLLNLESAGSPVGSWYQTFMEVADHLEAVRSPMQMIKAAMGAILSATGADRVCLEFGDEYAIDGETSFYLTDGGDSGSFRISRSLIDQVRESGNLVHVPIASADPVASQFVSVRREGISSSITMPIQALGKTFGILHADCVRDGAMLAPSDLQRVVFIGRLVASALGNRDLVTNIFKSQPSANNEEHYALQTTSPSCKDMVERVKLYAPADYTVLIRGETGTGKEVIARAIHDLSPRKEGVFVPVNCAAIPEQLMESELFGHDKGAFTGATQTKRGHFEEAHEGTIFLDEIGDMALDLQAKILRVLQDRIVTPIGSSKQIKVDVRILAATHQDLEVMVKEGRFREDLYYRLRELEIMLPALRDRKEDILMLCSRFLLKAAEDLGLPAAPELTSEALDHLHRYQWSGNIRELQHMLKGAALRAAGGAIAVEHLDASPQMSPSAETPEADSSSDTSTWKERLEGQERSALQETLESAEGNLTKGAELFGVPRTTYREKLMKHGLLEAK
jgi:transcriptional regulator with GAF, ATPase, and Fis domain